jgi:3D (Asp-Asp-Asp) domain-containing protein
MQKPPYDPSRPFDDKPPFDPSLPTSDKPPFDPSLPTSFGGGRARVTVYNNHEDQYGSESARKNPLTGKRQSQEGVTIAVDPKVIPYGSRVKIPALADLTPNRDGVFIAHDTGGAVKSRKASGGKEPVIDVYVAGQNRPEANARMAALDSAIGQMSNGSGNLDFELLDPAPAQKLDGDTGTGRIRSGLSTFAQTAEAGFGKAVEGLGTLGAQVVSAWNGTGTPQEAAAEERSLRQIIAKAKAAPDFPQKDARLSELEQRLATLGSSKEILDVPDAIRSAGRSVVADAEDRFTPNPAYAGEFFAETVPQVAGSAVQSVAPFLVPGVGPALGTAQAFAQTYQDTYEKNRAKGVDEDEAIRRGLLNGIVSGGLEPIGGGIVAGAMKKLAAGKAAQGVGRAIVQGTAGEGVTGSLQETASQVISQEQLNPMEIAKAGALEALGGFMMTGGAAGVGRVAQRFATPQPGDQAAAPAPANLASLSVGATELTPEEAALFATAPAAQAVPAPVAAPAPVATPTPVAAQAAPATAQPDPTDPSNPSDPTDPQPNEQNNQAPLPGQSQLRPALPEQQRVQLVPEQPPAQTPQAETAPPVAQPAGPTNAQPVTTPPPRKPTQAELAEAAYRAELQAELDAVNEENTVGLADALRRIGGLPSKKSRHFGEWSGELAMLIEERQGARKRFGNKRLFENLFDDEARSMDTVAEGLREEGFDVAGADDVFRLVDQWMRTNKEPRAALTNMGAEESMAGMPFSKQTATADTPALPPGVLTQAKASVKTLFSRAGMNPSTVWHASPDAIPAGVGGDLVRAEAAAGRAVEGFFLGGRVHLVASGIAQGAAQFGIPFETRAQQVALHETVGHDGLGAVLTSKSRRVFNSIVDGVYTRIPKAELSQIARDYQANVATPQGRADVVTEYLARQTEPGIPSQGIVARAIAKIRELLREVFPKLRMTDGDIVALLNAARNRVQSGRSDPNGIRFSMRAFHGTPHKVDRFSTAKIGTGEGSQAYGWGLYFAQNQAVADQYRNNLSYVDSDQMLIDGKPINSVRGLSDDDRFALEQLKNYGNLEAAITNTAPDAPFPNNKAHERLKKWKQDNRITHPRAGNIYTVELLPDEADFLDWDKPLSEQPETVRMALKPFIEPHPKGLTESTGAPGFAWKKTDRGVGTGVGIYWGLTKMLGGDKAASEYLNSFGVPGIRYLDANSRDGGSGTSNFVVFDENLVQILEENGAVVTTNPDGSKPQEIRFSKVPSQAQTEAAAASPEKRRGHVETVRRMLEVTPSVSDNVESFYRATTAEEVNAKANETIDTAGVDKAKDLFMNSKKADENTLALGHHVALRLQAMDRHAEATQVRIKMAENLTSPARALWYISTIAKTTPEGIQSFAESVTRTAAKDMGPELAAAYENIAALQAELAKVKRKLGAETVLEIQDYLRSLKLTPERLTELNTKLRDALVLSPENPGNARNKIVGMLVNFGMENKQATKLAEQAIRQFTAKAKKVRESLIKKMLAGVKARKERVPKSVLEKLMLLNNEGKLTDETLHAQIAKALGVPVFTKEAADKVAKLQKDYESAPEGTVKMVKGAQMLEAVHELVPSELASKVRAIQNIAMLFSGKTFLRNPIGNLGMFLLNSTADAVGAVIVDPATRIFTGRRSTTSPQLLARMRGLGEPIRVGKAGWQWAADQGLPVRQRLSEALRTVIDTSRMLSSQVTDPKQLTQQFKHTFSSRFGRMLEDGLALGLGPADLAFWGSAYQASIARSMAAAKANGQPQIAPTEAMVEQALWDAHRAIFQNENMVSFIFKKLEKLLNLPRVDADGNLKLDRKYGFGTATIAFSQVPGSILMQGLEASPLGVVNAVRKMHDLYNVLHSDKAGPDAKMISQRRFVEAASKVLVGTGTFILGAMFLKLGIISGAPDEDKDVEAMRRNMGIGGYSFNFSEFKRRMLSGDFTTPAKLHEAYQDGDVMFTYDWFQPAALSVMFGAEWAKKEEKIAGLKAKGESVVLAYAKTISDSVTRQPMMSGVNQLIRDTAAYGGGEAVMRKMIQIPGNFVPAVVRQTQQTMNETVAETRGGSFVDQELNKLQAKIPFLGDKFPAKLDAFGQAVERYNYGGNGFLNVWINPFTIAEAKRNPAANEMMRLYDATGKPEVVAPIQRPKVVVNGQPLQLTNEQIVQMQNYTGQLAAQTTISLMASPVFVRLPDEYKAKVIAQVLGGIQRAAKIEILGQVPFKEDQITQEMARLGRALGLVPRR